MTVRKKIKEFDLIYLESRPCKRCRATEKADSCQNTEHKKRGRPKLPKDDTRKAKRSNVMIPELVNSTFSSQKEDEEAPTMLTVIKKKKKRLNLVDLSLFFFWIDIYHSGFMLCKSLWWILRFPGSLPSRTIPSIHLRLYSSRRRRAYCQNTSSFA